MILIYLFPFYLGLHRDQLQLHDPHQRQGKKSKYFVLFFAQMPLFKDFIVLIKFPLIDQHQDQLRRLPLDQRQNQFNQLQGKIFNFWKQNT